jgi:hypothetical protein
MKKESKCEIIIIGPTKEQGLSIVDTWKKAEEKCEGPELNHKIVVAGGDIKSSNICMEDTKCKRLICLTAESQEDWEKVKIEWNKNFKEKCKGSCISIIAANKEEKSKKWAADINADCYVDLSSFEQTMNKLRNELSKSCDMKCPTRA